VAKVHFPRHHRLHHRGFEPQPDALADGAGFTEVLHAAGVEDMTDVRLVVLEPRGTIPVLKDG